MTRKPGFDQTAVLDAALSLFWENGFQDTSLAQLEQATGLKPGSIYNSFGSKKHLFLSVLEHYTNSVVAERVTAMVEHSQPLHGIHQFFITAFDQVPSTQLHGCLLTNTATEHCIEDADIRRTVKAGVAKMEAGFRRNLTRAQLAHELPDQTNINALATHLTSSFQGLEVMGRLNRNKKQLRLLSDMALANILPT